MANTSVEPQLLPSEQDRVGALQEKQVSFDVVELGVRNDDSELSLPPADGGKDAWLFLLAGFLMEGLVWGFPFAFGVFQDYYRTHEPFAGSSDIATIGTCALGIMYLSMPAVLFLQRLFPRATLWAPRVCIVGASLSLIASSFSRNTGHLIATQGVLYAIFGCVAYCPCLLYTDEWFIRRKGIAFSVMWASTALGGFIFPLLLESLLSKYGFRTTLRIWGVAIFAITFPLIYFVKPRLPIAATTAQAQLAQLAFVKQPFFLVFSVASMIQSAGYFLPSVYLPTYARAVLGAGSSLSALPVLLINVASVFGLVSVGALAGRLHVTTCIMISTVGAVLGIVFLWGFATSLPMLYAFCVVYGLTAGSYVSSWTGVMRQAVNEAATIRISPRTGRAAVGVADPIMVIGFLAAGRGLGNMVSGPLSEALIKGLPWEGQAIGAWGSGYGPLIAFTGATALVGGVPIFMRKMV